MRQLTEHEQIYLKGKDKTDEVLDFIRTGDKYGVRFIKDPGTTYRYNASDVRVIESALNAPKSRERFDYLKHIADELKLKNDHDDGSISILSRYYSKIGFVMPDGMLGAFLCGKLPEPKRNNYNTITDVVYPFGFNATQKDAVEKALSNQLSIIEGPPGTGKTQTILNIIANAVMRGENVAVVSSNNSATKNVQDKLKKYDLGFIAAYLGNKNNKMEFINSQEPLPDMTNWKLTQEVVAELRQTLGLRHGVLREKLAQQNELSVLKQELSAFQTEEKHFLQFFNSFDGPDVSANSYKEFQSAQKIETSRDALEIWLLCEIPQGKGLIAFVRYILKIFDRLNRLARKLLGQYPRDYLIAVFQRRFYELKISELTRSISVLTRELSLFDFNSQMREYTDISAQLFKAKLAEQYAARGRTVYKFEDIRNDSAAFIKDYPVILSTAYSLRNCLSDQTMYDYVIIDESSQVDLCTGALALSCARKAVVVGDLKQLPNVVDSKSASATDDIFAKYDLPEAYRYKNHSLLSALAEIFPEAPSTLLREHYRCHPKIIEFCNKKFYDGQLVILTEPKSEREPLIVYKTVEGNHERNRVNQRQIDVIKNEVIPQQKLSTADGSLGVVTPYRNQTCALQKAFAGLNVKADTVDKFQGQENDVIILSTVDNAISEFADNANRLNVAVSRAVEQLIVVVNDTDTMNDTNIGDLVRYIEYNNFTVVESAVYSIFDYLYRSYAERRREFLTKHRRVSEYDSENLMYALITSVLKDKGLSNLEVAVHVPLKMIIRDTSLMSPLEKQYALNILTHVDFLVFDTISKSPRFAVEVDGVAVHAEGTKQAGRDAMKNEILRKYSLPLFRFKTDGSGEREKLLNALDDVSCGVPSAEQDFGAAVRLADEAMYQAKRAGRNQVVVRETHDGD